MRIWALVTSAVLGICFFAASASAQLADPAVYGALPTVSAAEISPDGQTIVQIHAEDDITVPVGQSRRMRNALRDEGKEHEFIILKGEDHWLSSGKTRTEMLRRSIEFIGPYWRYKLDAQE